MDIMKYLIPVLLFTSLIGTIASQVSVGVNATSGATSTIIGLTTLMIAIVFIKWVSAGASGRK